jgi:PhnB protein
MHAMSYLFFNGNCEEALKFYEKTAGAKTDGIMKNKSAPEEQARMPGSDDLVMNAVLQIGSTTIMASDAPGDWYNKPQGFRVYLETDSAAEADRIFAAFADGGSVNSPIEPTFWAERFGMVTDKFGTPWMVGFTGSAAQG